VNSGQSSPLPRLHDVSQFYSQVLNARGGDEQKGSTRALACGPRRPRRGRRGTRTCVVPPKHESHGRSSPFPARAPEIASEGAYAPQRCALHPCQNPQILAFLLTQEAEKATNPDESIRNLQEALGYFRAVKKQYPDWKIEMVDGRIRMTEESLAGVWKSNQWTRNSKTRTKTLHQTVDNALVPPPGFPGRP